MMRRSPTPLSAMALSAMALSAIALAGSAMAQEPPVTLSVSMPATIDGVVQMSVSVEIGDGWSASAAGIPNPLLQLEPGNGAKLEGKVLEGRAQARNEYLFAPYERMIEPGVTNIPLQVAGDGETIGVNFVAYVRKEGEDKAYFVRRRVDLPLIAGSTASSSSPASRSSWGPPGATVLSIGDKAPDFEVPRADGSTLRLSDYLGKHDVIITTYRAHW